MARTKEMKKQMSDESPWRIYDWDDEGGQFRIERKSGEVSPWLCVTDAILCKYWAPNVSWPEERWRPSRTMPAVSL